MARRGDTAVAMRVLDAQVKTVKADGTLRKPPVADLHRLPGDTPHIETNLAPGELITAVELPRPVGGVQLYHKVRARASYAFALVSVRVQRMRGRAHVVGVAAFAWTRRTRRGVSAAPVID